MAKKIPDNLIHHVIKSSPRVDHNWDQYADGDWWELKRGEDYTILTQSARQSVDKWAKGEGLVAETANLKDGDGFALRIRAR